jgi:hypothetical protein
MSNAITADGVAIIVHYKEVAYGYTITVTECPQEPKETRFQTSIDGTGTHGQFAGGMDSRTLSAAISKVRKYRKLAQRGHF